LRLPLCAPRVARADHDLVARERPALAEPGPLFPRPPEDGDFHRRLPVQNVEGYVSRDFFKIFPVEGYQRGTDLSRREGDQGVEYHFS